MGIKVSVLLAIFTMITGCATQRPVLMQLGRNNNLHGTATASLLDEGKFDVANAANLSCSGKYKASERSLLILNVHCSDDRSGKIVIFRDPEGKNGRGDGTLSDGSKFSLIFGDGAKQ